MLLHTEAFAADEPEGSTQKGSQYISRKDLRWLGIFLLAFALILIPVWLHLKRQGEKAACSNNMRAVSAAVLLYSEQNDERLPIAFYPDAEGSPVLDNGFPITWATMVQEGMSARASFRCPSAKPEELTLVVPRQGTKPIELTYGMFAGASGRTARNYESPGSSVLLSETSNFGANETHNPTPFLDENGEPMKNDGFVIGLEGTNAQGPLLKERLDEILADENRNDGDPLKKGLKAPSWTTRLAFPTTAGAKFREDGPSRHGPGIHVIFIDGRLGIIRPNAARVDLDGSTASGRRWAVP